MNRAFKRTLDLKNFIATAAALLLTAAAASAEICYLEIDDVIEMQGPCVFDAEGNGDFFAADIDDRTAFVYFYIDDEGNGGAMWSGHESKANHSLGTLQRDGACWKNDEATLCAWES